MKLRCIIKVICVDVILCQEMKVILVIFYIMVFGQSIDVSHNLIKNTSHLSSCVVTIANKFLTKTNLKLLYDPANDAILEEVFPQLPGVGVISSLTRRNGTSALLPAESYIIFITNISYFRKRVPDLPLDATWNPRAKFLLVITENNLNTTDILTAIFHSMWQIMAIDLVMLTSIQTDHTSSTRLFAAHPYDVGNDCGDQVTNVTELGPCSHHHVTDLWRPRQLTPSDHSRCRYHMLTMAQEPYVMNITSHTNPGNAITVARILNASDSLHLQLHEPRIEYMSDMLNGRGMITLIADLNASPNNLRFCGVVGPNSANAAYLPHFDLSVYVFPDGLMALVPTAHAVPFWKIPLLVFTQSVWLLDVITMIALGIVWWIIAWISSEDTPLSTCLLNTFSLNLRVAIPRLPPHRMLRFLIISWAIFAMTIDAMFEGKFSSFIAMGLYEHQIATLQELVQSNLRLYVQYAYKQYVFDEMDGSGVKLLEKRLVISSNAKNISNDLLYVAHSGKYATVASYRLVQYMSPVTFDRDTGRQRLYMLSDPLLRYCTVLLLRQGHPFLELLNERILLLQSAGIIRKIQLDLDRFRLGRRRDRILATMMQLNIYHMQAPFFFLLFGLICSTLVFALETIHIFLKKN